MNYFMLIVAALLYGVDFAVNKVYQKINGSTPRAAFFFNTVLGLLMAVIFFFVNGMKLQFSVYSFLMAVLMSTLTMSYNLIGFRLLKEGTMALYTLFLMSGGMVLPYILGLLFWNEPFRILRTAGLLLILSGVILSNFGGKQLKLKQILMCSVVFLLNGCVSTISQIHQTQTVYETVGTLDFVILAGLGRFLIAGLLLLVTREQNAPEDKKCRWQKAIPIVAASAAASGAAYSLQLFGAKSLPATVLYPFITGGSIVCSSLMGVIFYKEKLSPKLILSVVLCFAGTVMFL